MLEFMMLKCFIEHLIIIFQLKGSTNTVMDRPTQLYLLKHNLIRLSVALPQLHGNQQITQSTRISKNNLSYFQLRLNKRCSLQIRRLQYLTHRTLDQPLVMGLIWRSVIMQMWKKLAILNSLIHMPTIDTQRKINTRLSCLQVNKMAITLSLSNGRFGNQILTIDQK